MSGTGKPASRERARAALLLFCAVLFACLLGIWSRPTGLLASIWPANAVMLTILLRVPDSARWTGWLAGAAAMMMADLLTEFTPFRAALLNGANLASISVAYLILRHLPDEILQLRQPQAIAYLMLAAALGSASAGIIGGYANPILFDGSFLSGFTLWWVTELVNYAALLPVLLTLPTRFRLEEIRGNLRTALSLQRVLPALTVIASCVVALLVHGPGAIAFPVLALLWCGLVYPVFLTASLALLFSILALVVIASGHLPAYPEDFAQPLISLRLGIAVVAIAPVLLSIVTRSRQELLRRLHYLSTHDLLTGVNNRRAFYHDVTHTLEASDTSHAILMLDLDHFKTINDSHGHAVGDRVLREVAERIQSCLRPADRIGRMGGEEFSILLHDCDAETATRIAERIRKSIAGMPITSDNNLRIQVTVSIGWTLSKPHNAPRLDRLMRIADAALYRSKQRGRNQVSAALYGPAPDLPA